MLGVEKAIPSKMLVRTSNRRIHTVDTHAGLVGRARFLGYSQLRCSRRAVISCVHAQAVAGLAADARVLVNHGRNEASQYRTFYGSIIPGHVLNSRISYVLHLSFRS